MFVPMGDIHHQSGPLQSSHVEPLTSHSIPSSSPSTSSISSAPPSMAISKKSSKSFEPFSVGLTTTRPFFSNKNPTGEMRQLHRLSMMNLEYTTDGRDSLMSVGETLDCLGRSIRIVPHALTVRVKMSQDNEGSLDQPRRDIHDIGIFPRRTHDFVCQGLSRPVSHALGLVTKSTLDMTVSFAEGRSPSSERCPPGSWSSPHSSLSPWHGRVECC